MRRPACIVLICGVMVWPSIARGEDPSTGGQTGHAATAHEAAGSHDEHGDKPALLSFDPGNALWSIIVFVLLLVVLRRFAWGPILAALQQRERLIHDSIEEARRERQEADKLLKQYQQQVEKAREEATAIVEEGKRDAEAVRRRIHEEARREADEMIGRARREIAIARDDAIQQLYERTLDLSTEVAGKIIGRRLSAQDQRALLDEALEEASRARV